MKIALPYDRGRIHPHFGHCQYFEIYTVSDGHVQGRMVIPCSGGGHKYMTSLMKKLNINVVIASHMGKPALSLLREYEISVYMGLSGSTENAVLAYLEGTLEGYNTKGLDLSLLEDGCHCHEEE